MPAIINEQYSIEVIVLPQFAKFLFQWPFRHFQMLGPLLPSFTIANAITVTFDHYKNRFHAHMHVKQ